MMTEYVHVIHMAEMSISIMLCIEMDIPACPNPACLETDDQPLLLCDPLLFLLLYVKSH